MKSPFFYIYWTVLTNKAKIAKYENCTIFIRDGAKCGVNLKPLQNRL